MEHGFTWFSLFGYHGAVPAWHIFSAGLVSLLLIAFGLKAKKAQAASPEHHVIPEEEVTTRSLADFFVSAIDGIVQDQMGHHGRSMVPLFGSIFIFIFINNALGLIPGFLPATTNISTNFAIAGIVFVLTHYYGVKEHGVGYLKHFMGPIVWLAPLMFIIEMISHIVRPVSLSIRLYGNMDGDHQVLGIFSGLVPLLVPVIFLFLGLLVSTIQAFVFTLLSIVYVSLATSHDH